MQQQQQELKDNGVIGYFCCLFMLISLYPHSTPSSSSSPIPFPQPQPKVVVIAIIEFRNHLYTRVRYSTLYNIGSVITFHLRYNSYIILHNGTLIVVLGVALLDGIENVMNWKQCLDCRRLRHRHRFSLRRSYIFIYSILLQLYIVGD